QNRKARHRVLLAEAYPDNAKVDWPARSCFVFGSRLRYETRRRSVTGQPFFCAHRTNTNASPPIFHRAEPPSRSGLANRRPVAALPSRGDSSKARTHQKTSEIRCFPQQPRIAPRPSWPAGLRIECSSQIGQEWILEPAS